MFINNKRKKMRNRVIFATAGVFLLSFGIWLNYQAQPEDTAEDVVKNVEVKETQSESASGDDDKKNNERTGTESRPETYLIKEVEGVVKVFVCDEAGNKELYLITSIPFDLLSESDQQLFIDGVEMKTEEDLGEFLQNFDS